VGKGLSVEPGGGGLKPGNNILIIIPKMHVHLCFILSAGKGGRTRVSREKGSSSAIRLTDCQKVNWSDSCRETLVHPLNRKGMYPCLFRDSRHIPCLNSWNLR
jgi:hypothetical protein